MKLVLNWHFKGLLGVNRELIGCSLSAYREHIWSLSVLCCESIGSLLVVNKGFVWS